VRGAGGREAVSQSRWQCYLSGSRKALHPANAARAGSHALPAFAFQDSPAQIRHRWLHRPVAALVRKIGWANLWAPRRARRQVRAQLFAGDLPIHPKWVMEGVCRTRGKHGTLQNAKEPIVQVIRHPSSPPTFQETGTFTLASRKADVAREGDGLVGRSAGPVRFWLGPGCS
jgi:hypothetical protein